jgi:SAM-dependent methyltransferase
MDIFSSDPVEKYGKLLFREISEEEYNANNINNLKSRIKNNHIVYRLLIEVFSPVFTFYSNRYLKSFIKSNFDETSDILVNLGSGNSKIHDRAINVDFFPYQNVDVVCDIENLPFQDNSIDLIANIAVLEHVPAPEKVVSEIDRVLKPGGRVYSVIPFIQGFHASPYDFSRRTSAGMKELYKDFNIEEVKCIGGPTSGLLWILQEWIAITFSFGSKKLHSLIYLLLLFVLWPIKLLDFILIHHPQAKNISSAFLILAQKR